MPVVTLVSGRNHTADTTVPLFLCASLGMAHVLDVNSEHLQTLLGTERCDQERYGYWRAH
jgi:hypothetical protein